MSDLRERLEALALYLGRAGSPVDVATLREVLAHPERLMGEPVSWIEHHKGGDNLVWEPIKRGTEIGYSPLYAPKTKENGNG